MAVPDALQPGSRLWGVAAGSVAVLVGAVSLLPPRGTPVGDIADLGELRATIGHVLAYVLLAVLFVMAVRTSDPNSSVARSAVLVVLILTGYGALLEILQGAAGSRSFQVQDVLANAAGAIVGAGLALPIRRRCFAG